MRTLKTVRVPEAMAAPFEQAENVVSQYFREMRQAPERGTIEIFGERYVLVRAASLSVEFFTMVEDLYGPGARREAHTFARNILFDLAHAIGRSDARNFHAKMRLADPLARLSAGPVHFSHSGWAFVDIAPESRPESGPGYYLVYDHPYSFESDAWVQAGRPQEFPVCIMNAGYSSGWCEESFGLELVATEVLCRATGDDTCRFIMAPPARIEQHLARYIEERPQLAPRLRRYSIPDFFARKRAEEEIRRLVDRLKELDRLKTTFVANVSHELRTPLALILGLTERCAERDRLSDEQQRDLDGVARNARLLLKQVNDLLDISKLEADKMRLDRATIDLAQLTRTTSSYFEEVAAERAISFEVLAQATLTADVDAEKLQRVLVNLLSNAFKFTPRRGVVRVRLSEAEGGRARIEVSDSGPGVPAAHRAAIFERFVAFEVERGRFGGTGLGLAIAQELVKLHDGAIEVGDAIEGGARFVVELPLGLRRGGGPLATVAPLAEEMLRATVEGLIPPRPPEATPPAADGPLVLIVEDNLELNRFLADKLGADHRVATAFDGVQGLEQARALRPDVIVTDVMMPGMGGDELVAAVRSLPELASVPILVLTARSDDDLRIKLLRQGAQDYLMKPFSTEELRARVANLVKTKRIRDMMQRELASDVRDVEVLTAELTRRKRELQTAVETVREACDRAEQASRTKSLFLRLVSHELLTPITAQRLQLDLLDRGFDGELSPAQAVRLKKVGGATLRLQNLIESILEHARIETGRLALKVEEFDLAELSASVLDELRPLAEPKRLELRLSAQPGLPLLRSDERLIRIVLVNLVGNGVKFTERGSVEIALHHEGAAHRIVVTDTGPGIPADRQAQVFQPFEQLEDVNLKHVPGVGLGLALVREIVEAVSGRIELRSEVGRGSSFEVTLAER